MLSKEKFNKAIKKLMDQEDTINAINKEIRKTDYAVGYMDFFPENNGSLVCELLGAAMGLGEKDDLIEWWCYETYFGRSFEIGDVEDTFLSEDHPYREPDLTTSDNLYDYIIFLVSDAYNKGKE